MESETQQYCPECGAVMVQDDDPMNTELWSCTRCDNYEIE